MIRNLNQLDQTLGNYDSKGWTKKVGNEISEQFGSIESGGLEGANPSGRTFGDFLADSLVKVNSVQNEADVAMQKLASGESKDLHETLLTVEKAEIAFKTMNQIRTKVIDAYKEIMRMQI